MSPKMKKILILVLVLSFLFGSNASAGTSRKTTTAEPLETDTIILNLGPGVEYSEITDSGPGYILSFHPDSRTDLMYYYPNPENYGIHTPFPYCTPEEFKAFILKNNNAIQVGKVPEEDVHFYETTFAGEKCYAWEISYEYKGVVMYDREIHRISTMDYFSFHAIRENTLDESTQQLESILTWKEDPLAVG